MANDISIFDAGVNLAVEVGSHVPQGGLVDLMNLGPNVAWVKSYPATIPSNQNEVSPGQQAGGVPLRPGDSVKVRVPAYPVAVDTFVPAVLSISTGARIAFNVEGS